MSIRNNAPMCQVCPEKTKKHCLTPGDPGPSCLNIDSSKVSTADFNCLDCGFGCYIPWNYCPQCGAKFVSPLFCPSCSNCSFKKKEGKLWVCKKGFEIDQEHLVRKMSAEKTGEFEKRIERKRQSFVDWEKREKLDRRQRQCIQIILSELTDFDRFVDEARKEFWAWFSRLYSVEYYKSKAKWLEDGEKLIEKYFGEKKVQEEGDLEDEC